MNLKQKCREMNMPYFTVVKRLSRGWSLDKALTTPRVHQPRERIFYEGKPLSELFNEEELLVIRKRVKGGMSVEEAIKLPMKKNHPTGLDRSSLTEKEYHKEYRRLRRKNVTEL